MSDLSAICTYCDVAAGEPCRDSMGRRLTTTHPRRGTRVAKRLAPPPGHTSSCDTTTLETGARCVYWCPTMGVLAPLQRCVETLERIGGNPGAEAALLGRVALEHWSRDDV